MRINTEETKMYFNDSIQEKYFDYLKERNVISEEYVQSLRNGQYGMLEENILLINKEEYVVSYILGSGKESIYDLIRVNQFYDLAPEVGTAFAILLGDDFLFFKPNDKRVYFFYRDTEKITEVATDYEAFLKQIKFQGE